MTYSRLALLLLPLVATAQPALQKIDVKGVPAPQVPALVRETGLAPGQAASKASYDQACDRLIKTGLIQSCNYRFTETAVEFDVKESMRTMKAVIALPGVKDDELWAWLAANEPLVQATMPDNDDATQFYVRAIRRFAESRGLASGIVPNIYTDLETKQTTLRFRPANLPVVNSVIFKGLGTVDAAAYKERIERLAKGQGFFEPDFRQLLEFNISPMFARLGYLGVSYPSVTFKEGEVVVEVAPGPVYKFGKVPQGLSSGVVADWSKVQTVAQSLEKAARDEGYLEARARMSRQLRPDQTADVDIQVDRGRQFHFGELRVTGLDPSTTARLTRRWTMKRGEPMRESYPYDFLKLASDEGLLGRRSLDLAVRFEPKPEEPGVIDVVIAFK